MQGEFLGVWPETWQQIWLPLIEQPVSDDEDGLGEDVFCELYREIAKALKSPPSIGDLADVIGNASQSRNAFQEVTPEQLAGERALVGFLEAVYDSLEDFGGDALTNRYFNLLSTFIAKFNVRYDLRRPCILCPTLPGVFASLVQDLRTQTNADPHLDALMRDFENAIRDLRQGCSDGRIKTCIQKQVNLLEAIGRTFPGVTGTTLGVICEQVGTWPHEKLKAAMKDLYSFACDYPGIRHGGTSASALRPVDMRDMVAMSILLAGFTPYLSNSLNADLMFRGS